jgi:hypothetical protein
MLGMSLGNFGIVALVTSVLFIYIWLRSHGEIHTPHARVDSRAGDEGDD